MQCIAKPGPVYNFLWHIWHLKCFAFWCCIRIFSSSKSLLQYLLKAVKETFNTRSDFLDRTKIINISVIFFWSKSKSQEASLSIRSVINILRMSETKHPPTIQHIPLYTGTKLGRCLHAIRIIIWFHIVWLMVFKSYLFFSSRVWTLLKH